MSWSRAVIAVLLSALSLAASPGARAADEPEGGKLPRGDAEKGEQHYLRYCRGCHGVDGQGDGLVFMPHVNNLTRKGYIDLLPDSYIYTAIMKGGPGIGKSSYMPAWETTLSQEQVLDIIAHIRKLPLHENP